MWALLGSRWHADFAVAGSCTSQPNSRAPLASPLGPWHAGCSRNLSSLPASVFDPAACSGLGGPRRAIVDELPVCLVPRRPALRTVPSPRDCPLGVVLPRELDTLQARQHSSLPRSPAPDLGAHLGSHLSSDDANLSAPPSSSLLTPSSSSLLPVAGVAHYRVVPAAVAALAESARLSQQPPEATLRQRAQVFSGGSHKAVRRKSLSGLLSSKVPSGERSYRALCLGPQDNS